MCLIYPYGYKVVVKELMYVGIFSRYPTQQF